MEKLNLQNGNVNQDEFEFILIREAKRVARREPDKEFKDFENGVKLDKLSYVTKDEKGNYKIKSDNRRRLITKLNILFFGSIWGTMVLIFYIVFEHLQ